MKRAMLATAIAGLALCAIAATNGREPYWKKIREALEQGLPKTALESVDPIIRRAQEDHAWGEAIRAVVLKIALEAGIQGNKPEEKVTRMQAAIERAPAGMRPAMEAILAEWYWQYFQQNRWRFMSRSRTAAAPGSDFTTWDLPRIYAEIDAHFTRALAGATQLQRTPIGQYADLFLGGNAPDTYRPTLYDAVAFEALAFYGSGEQAGARPEDAFVLQADSPAFAPAAEFARWRIATPDTGSPVLKGLRLYQDLLRFHAADPVPTAHLDADLWRLAFVHEHAVGGSRDARHVAALARLVEMHADHELSARALHEWASVLQRQGDLVGARRLALRGFQRFPKSTGGERCFNVVREIEEPALSVRVSEGVWNTPRAALAVSYRNLGRVYFRLVPFDYLAASGHTPNGYPSPGQVDVQALRGRTPARAWSETLPSTPDFKARTESFPAPAGLAPGSYYLLSSARADFSETDNEVSTTLVWVSNLALVTRGGRPRGLEGFVLDAVSGDPIAGADIRTWKWKQHYSGAEPGPTARSDANGLFHIVDADRMTDLLVTKGDQRLGGAGYFPNFQPYAMQPEEQTIFFTDRAIYRPGQTIRFKGLCIRLDREQDDYATLPRRPVRVTLRDPNGREVAKSDHLTNEHGSFSGSFTAPGDVLLGAMSIRCEGGPGGAAQFRVEEYKRPKFLVALEAPREPARLAGPVEVGGRAIAYTGAPVDGAQVKWRVVREVRYPDWWGWRFWWYVRPAGGSQEIAHGVASTDAEGHFTVPFRALPDSSVSAEQEPVFRFSVFADVTDGAGETRSAGRSVSAGYTTLAASLWTREWQVRSEPVELTVRTTTLDGEPQGAAGTLTVVRLREPAHVARTTSVPPGEEYDPYEGWQGYEEVAPVRAERSVDPTDSGTWPDGPVVHEQPVRTDSSGIAKVRLRLEVGLYRAKLATRDRFGRPVFAMFPLRVLDPGAGRCALKVPDVFAVRETSVEPGQEFLAVWGTGYERGPAFIEIEHRGRLLGAWWTRAGETQVAIRQKVDEAMRGGFTVRVTRVRENRAYLHEQAVSVPWSNKSLSLRWEHFVSKLLPGQHETWTAVVTGPDATRAAAEMVATLYDASLDAFAPHGWPGGIGGFRNSYDLRGPSFRVGPAALYHLLGSWRRERQSGVLLYRSLPMGLLWGDYTYGLLGLPSPKGTRAPSAPIIGGVKQLESIEVMAERRVDTKSSATKSMAFAQSLDGVDRSVDSQPPANEPPMRGGRPGELAITLPPGVTAPAADLDRVTARRNLEETAFFFPQLLADANGEVRMEFTMPEALTEWRFLGFAHDDRLRSGLLEGRAVTSKDLMVQPNPPRFLREGDELEFTVKVTNRADAAQRGRVRLTFTDASSGESADAALQNRTPELVLDVPARSSHTYAWRLRVPDDLGALTYKAVASTGTLSDGEEGWLPVLSRSILVIESLPLPIRGPLLKVFDFERLRRSGESGTLRHRSLTVQMVSNPAWYAVMALPYLIEYPYECSEQTFNRLYANTLARHIAQSDPKIRRVFDQWRDTKALDSPLEKNPELKSVMIEETPWLRQAQAESQARRNVGILFDANRLDHETTRLVQRLEQMQLPDGSWPWFPGGRGDDYITLYITTGFGRLRHLGVNLPTGAAVRSLERLDDWSERMYREVLRDGRRELNNLSPTIALYLYGRSFFLADRPILPEHREATDYWLGQGRRYWLQLGHRQSLGHLALALKRFGDPVTARAIMRSVREYAVTNEEMGMFWRDEERSWWWYRAPIETQAMMIEAFSEVMADSAAVEECKVWLLKQKQTQDWKTTKATADAVYALLLRGTGMLASDALVEVSLGATAIRPEHVEAGTGFYEQRFGGREVRPEMARVTVHKRDPGVAWGSVHWQYLEDMSKVTAYTGTPLTLRKSLFVRRASTQGPVLDAVTGPVKVGDELIVRIELRTDRAMEYVHLKDYRASGVEPVNVLSGWRQQDGLYYYEETRDVASHFFISWLPKGTYVFEYPVRVQHRGVFPSGVAEIQCLYAPEFNSHSESVKVEVK